MLFWGLLSVSLVALGLAAGCGGGAELPADYRGVDVPVRMAAYVPPVPRPVPTGPGGRTLPEDVVRGEMEQLLAGQARQAVTVSPVCDRPLQPGGAQLAAQCSVMVQGVSVPFAVSVSGAGRPFYQVGVRQLRGLLLASAIRDAWADGRRQSGERLSCEAGMPAAGLVTLDGPTPYRCAVGSRVFQVRIEVRGRDSRIAFDPVP